METHLLGSIILLLLIACIVAILAEWFKQPYTIALVLVGLVVALTHLTPSLRISHDVTFTLILPPLLFQGALHMDLARLRDNWKSITLLAVPGVVCSTFLIGFLLHHIWGIALIYTLLFGALITPTDPISVLSILKRVGAPQRLRIVLEGESLFNDGTGVVIFSLILGILMGHDNFHFSDAVSRFLFVTGGGTLIGALLGYFVYRLLKEIDNHLLEVAITVVLVFGTPLIAEMLYFSGIIAVVVAGLIIGNYGRLYSMSENTRKSLETFWEVIDFLINSILFLVIGLELQVVHGHSFFLFNGAIFSAILVVLFARFIVVYPIVWLRDRFSQDRLPKNWTHILFWGGLRGSLSIALVVGLPVDFPHRELFLTVAFSIVLFSLVVQGLTIQPLMKKFNLTSNQ